ncbi:MAG: hypothetical protein IPL84_13075 [Chitinophagaceae bacterium]|nr:hypothetical protein [Chitinophagaceae bacterium]
MKNIIFKFIAASALLFSACKKIDLSGPIDFSGTTPIGTNNVSFYTYALDFIKLPVNRYFIYKDSATGIFDSVVVTQSILETRFEPAHSGFPGTYALNYENYRLTLTKYQVSPSINEVWYNAVANSHYSWFWPAPSTGIDSNFNFYSTGVSNFWFPLSSSGSSQYNYLPTLTIEGTAYSNVHQFSASNELPANNPNYNASVFYWVKGIGFIKKEIRTFNTVKTSLLIRFG